MYRFIVGQDEKVVLYRNKVPLRLLEANEKPYKFYLRGYNVKRWEMSQPFISDQKDVEVLKDCEWLKDELEVVNVDHLERAVIWVKGRIFIILETGEYVYWKNLRSFDIEKISAVDPVIRHNKISEFYRYAKMSQVMSVYNVAQGSIGVLFTADGKRRQLEAGTYAMWKNVEPFEFRAQEMRLEQMAISGQELMTKDNMTLRVNLDVSYQVENVDKFIDVSQSATSFLYNRAQLALRELVSHQTLDNLLAEKDSLSKELFSVIDEAAKDVGITVKYAGVRDIILPGDLKDILNQVITAKKNAEANVIKRREETASTRSLLNTAKLIEDNPIMMRLKEIEAAQEIMQKVDTVTMFDGLAGLLDGVKLSK